MSRFRATQTDLVASAEVLRAFWRGEDSDDAEVGSLVMADLVDCARLWRTMATRKRKGRRG